MKKLIRKLKLEKKDKSFYCWEGQYVVILKDKMGHIDYEIVSEDALKSMLSAPKKEIIFIFKYEDKLVIETKFEELKEGNGNENNNI